MLGSLFHRILRAGLLIAAMTAAGPVLAQAAFNVDLPAQELADALREVGRQTSTNILFEPSVVQGMKVAALRAKLTSDEAIAALLRGTGLSAQRTSADTVVVKRVVAPSSRAPEDPTTKGDKKPGGFPVAQANSGQDPSPSSVSPANQPESEQSAEQETADQHQKLPEILVKGSKILNVDVKRTEDDAQPYYIFDSQQLEQSGAVNVEDFLKQQLTMNTTAQANVQGNPLTGLGATSQINLRGLGTNETLVLIDGRRAAGVSAQSFAYQPDINGIPVAAIERIEVLPSSASAIYGGAAMGGVVNIILKKKYEGGDISYTFENVTEGHAPLRTLNATYGFSLLGGKTNVMLAGRYSEGEVLTLGDRPELIRQGYTNILQSDPGFFSSGPASPVLGNTPNIGSADTDANGNPTNLTLKSNGASLGSPIATIAPGASAAIPSTIIPGRWNYALAPTAQETGLDFPLGSVPRVKSFMVSVRQEVTSAVDFFTDFSNASNIGVSAYAPYSTGGSNSVFVPASSPANPFNQNVNVSFPNTLTEPYSVDTVTRRATAGLVARLPHEWTSELDYTWSQASIGYSYNDSFGAQDYFGAAVAAGTLNPFLDTLAHPLDLSTYIALNSYSAKSYLNDVGLRSSGPVGWFPWGRPTLTVGLEHRKEGFDSSSYTTFNPNFPIDNEDILFFPQSQSTDSIYLETEVPLVTDKNALPGVRSLALQLAVRSERYTVYTQTAREFLSPPSLQALNSPLGAQTIKYSSTNPTIGLKYQPMQDLTFRVSYASAFLPPTASEFLPNPTITPYTVNITDPLNGLNYGVQLTGGGNPNLQPQKSRDWDIGAILEPQVDVLKGLRVDVEYYQITQPNYITQPTPQQAASMPGRFTRDPTTGLITVVDVSYLNAEEYKTSGYDLTIDYKKSTSYGTFSVHALGTWIAQDERQFTIGGPFLNFVGYPSENGEAKIKANATLSWQYRQWTLGWTTTYFGSYQSAGAPADPADPNDTHYTLAQGGYTIPSQTYHQLFGGYDTGKNRVSLLSDIKVQFGIKNIFNKIPPLDVYYQPYYYSPYGDARLRDYWITLSKSF